MKYDSLTKYLRNINQDRIQLTFDELESILGFNLGKSPRNHRQWWANGGHSHASAWMDAGYKVESVSLTQECVMFAKAGSAMIPRTASKPYMKNAAGTPIVINKATSARTVIKNPSEGAITLCGYPFRFAQEIVPQADGNGNVIEIYPKLDPARRLNKYGEPPFCRFDVKLPSRPGVYIWALEDEIVYIGEAQDLQKRFYGYGHISAANCYHNGRNTNCKMNKVVLEQAKKGQYVKLYFYETVEYKKVELELLRQYKTKYNVKDN